MICNLIAHLFQFHQRHVCCYEATRSIFSSFSTSDKVPHDLRIELVEFIAPEDHDDNAPDDEWTVFIECDNHVDSALRLYGRCRY